MAWYVGNNEVMGFEPKDRELLIQTSNDVGWIKQEHGRRLEELEKEDKILHHRINKVRNLFGGITTIASTIVAGIVAYFKLIKGD